MAKPQRPRSHELETESQRAFAAALPSSLVVRDASDDYGIDREVEVFEAGEATGLTFKVQLKGTDRSGESRRIRREALNYWRDLDVPVLLVSYEVPTDRLRCRWVHSIGLEAGSGAKKLTVHMSPTVMDHLWAHSLGDQLRIIRALRSGEISKPLPIRLSIEESLNDGPLTGLLAELLQVSRQGAHPLRRARDEEPALELEVGEDLLRARLPLDWASATVRGPVVVDSYALTRVLAHDELAIAATTLRPVSERVAIDLARAAGPLAPVWASYEVAERMAFTLAEHDPVLLLEIMRSVAELHEAQVEGTLDVYRLALRDAVDVASDAEFEQWSQVMESHAAIANDAGRQMFNLGQVHRDRRDWPKANHFLQRAAALDPRYASDHIWLQAMAGVEWELQDYALSAAHYREALDAGATFQRTAPLLADSLLFAGQFAAARQALADWSPVGEERDRIGVIRIAVLDHVLDVVGLDEQSRVPPTANQVQSVFDATDHDRPAAAIDLLRTTDALEPVLWDALTSAEDLKASFRPLLVASVALVNDASAWSITVLAALGSDQPEDVTRAILNEGRFICRDEFYETLQVLADQQHADNADYLRRLIAETYEQDPTSHGITVRLVHPDVNAPQWVMDEAWIGEPGAVPEENQ